MRHAKHLVRAALILTVGAVGALLSRSLLVPASFGDYGYFRGDAVKAEMAKPTHIGPRDVCKSCHLERWNEKDAGRHASLNCTGCHAAVDTHAAKGQKTAAMKTNRQATLCLRCHRQFLGRPEGFPQIDPEEHLDTMGVEYSDEVCFDCHDPHSPKEGL